MNLKRSLIVSIIAFAVAGVSFWLLHSPHPIAHRAPINGRPTHSTAPVVKTTTYHIGDTQAYQDTDVRLNSVYTLDGRYFAVDLTVTNNSDTPLAVQDIKAVSGIYVDGQGWRQPISLDFAPEVAPHTSQSGHVMYEWDQTELVDTVQYASLNWYL